MGALEGILEKFDWLGLHDLDRRERDAETAQLLLYATEETWVANSNAQPVSRFADVGREHTGNGERGYPVKIVPSLELQEAVLTLRRLNPSLRQPLASEDGEDRFLSRRDLRNVGEVDVQRHVRPDEHPAKGRNASSHFG